jgi:hypothetical protein
MSQNNTQAAYDAKIESVSLQAEILIFINETEHYKEGIVTDIYFQS